MHKQTSLLNKKQVYTYLTIVLLLSKFELYVNNLENERESGVLTMHICAFGIMPAATQKSNCQISKAEVCSFVKFNLILWAMSYAVLLPSHT